MATAAHHFNITSTHIKETLTMTKIDYSNLSAKAAATSFTVNGNAAATKLSDAVAAIAAYLSTPPSTGAAKANAAVAAQQFNALVAAINAFSA